jgi:hypothetical protein
VRAPQLAERIRDFRFSRVAKIVANDLPVQPHPLIMHVAPLSMLSRSKTFFVVRINWPRGAWSPQDRENGIDPMTGLDPLRGRGGRTEPRK